MLMMPSIALPTGPYDWHEQKLPRALYESRLSDFRKVMAENRVGRTVVHGNGFDHVALHWLTHFTPKLGPAYALISSDGPVRLLFAGGPGMKPSAQRLTWVVDVVALKSVEQDVKRWLDQTTPAQSQFGLVEGSSMLRGDWLAVQRAAGAPTVQLDAAIAGICAGQRVSESAQQAMQACRARLIEVAVSGADLRLASIEAERAAYAAGAQDVRWRMSRSPGCAPTTLPDKPLPVTGETAVVLAVRHEGMWATDRFILKPR